MSHTQIKPIVTTIYGTDLQTSQLYRRPYAIKPKTTLNEKFNIQAGVAPNLGTYPAMNYVAIGNKGVKKVVGVKGIEIDEPLQHSPTDGALFNHLPFVVREPNNDLTPQERERFALRCIEEHHGKRFIVYYLRRLDLTDTQTTLKHYTVTRQGQDVTTSSEEFIPTDEVLSPQPRPLTSVNVNTLKGEYIRCEAMVRFEMNQWDLAELVNAANIIYGSDRYAVINELALVTGVDKVVEGETGTGSANFNYKEAIACQVCAFIATDFKAYYQNKATSLDLNIGASEPLMELAKP